MKAALIAAYVAVALSGHASAGWIDAEILSTPSNTDNDCNGDQQTGFDWSGLPTGSFSSFGGFDFSGFTCSNSFTNRSAPSKRSLPIRDDFQVCSLATECIIAN